MDKNEIISRLKEFPYSRDEYWVITGSAMVLYGIREKTHDIEIFENWKCGSIEHIELIKNFQKN